MIKSYIFPFFNRFLHLLFIVCFALSYLLASTQKGFVWHAVLGLVFGAALACRVVWGFVGTNFSRFADFHFSGVFEYLCSIVGDKKHFIAHNPASSWAVVLVFVLGILSVVSGLLLWGQNEQKGLFGGLYFAYMPNLSVLHEFCVNALLAVIVVHICGVLIDKFFNKFDSLNAIINGFKLTQKDESVRLSTAQKAFCAFALCVLAFLCVFISKPTNSLLYASVAPEFSLQKPYALYKKECGSCHIAYAPYLLPQKAWANLAKENDDEIAISKYKFYEKAHQNLPNVLFNDERIKSRANCEACHKRAELGFFGKSEVDFVKINEVKRALKGD